ncbi:AraC family transcriptional regulator [Dysgonomonas sp. 216]|uniref:helix-turn-helix domain-containing protein n=1 Tax=Dysgonomonas sp. 216 TaxID=2302934 RepID=UPI0013D876E0|nr:helix-turn-helix transcriptional regulator [Dysgonomonas sp. 216]NDW18212.1 AraC family transcriptional regulator [Dysgonomonas sp. 216]
MSLLYKEEHLSCIHYQKNRPPILNHQLEKGEAFEREVFGESVFLFLIEGEISVSFDGFENESLSGQKIILIPINCIFKAKAKTNSRFLTLRLGVQVQMCASFSMTQLYPFYDEPSDKNMCALTFNNQMKLFVELLEAYIKDGVNCAHLYEIKREELFYIFRAYYSKELLARFLYPILGKEDVYFKKLVLENCLKVKNVAELAQIVNYSTSGFIKKFTRSFNESPYRWLSQYKADRVLTELHSTEKTFKEITDEYHFSSIPHFIEFCKKQYGLTPGKIRKKKEDTRNAHKGKNV